MSRTAGAVRQVRDSWTTHELHAQLLDGDIVIARESRAGTSFTVRQFPGAVQFSVAVRDEAVRLARGFAVNEELDVWYCDAGKWLLLERYRRD